MARPTKNNLQYFPLDVTFFDDHKILSIEEEFGVKGGYLAVRIISMVYADKGYYLEWPERFEVTCAKRVGNGFTGALVREVLNACFRVELFNKEIFDQYQVITSRGIQKRWIEVQTMMRRKLEVNESLWLIYSEETPIDSAETPPPAAIIPIKERKRNERSKSHSGARAPAVGKKDKTEYWKKLVAAWYDFYGQRFKKDDGVTPAKPMFNDVQGEHLKHIMGYLKTIALEAKREWSEEYAVYCLRGFLQKGFDHDNWLKTHFELGNLLSKFNSITNSTKNNGSDSKTLRPGANNRQTGATKLANALTANLGGAATA